MYTNHVEKNFTYYKFVKLNFCREALHLIYLITIVLNYKETGIRIYNKVVVIKTARPFYEIAD
jgi:hypothetical protein